MEKEYNKAKQDTHGNIDESVSTFESNRKPCVNGEEDADGNKTNTKHKQNKRVGREANNKEDNSDKPSRWKQDTHGDGSIYMMYSTNRVA
jgi:hypothetical protein